MYHQQTLQNFKPTYQHQTLQQRQENFGQINHRVNTSDISEQDENNQNAANCPEFDLRQQTVFVSRQQ
jgi:hypothetical protein